MQRCGLTRSGLRTWKRNSALFGASLLASLLIWNVGCAPGGLRAVGKQATIRIGGVWGVTVDAVNGTVEIGIFSRSPSPKPSPSLKPSPTPSPLPLPAATAAPALPLGSKALWTPSGGGGGADGLQGSLRLAVRLADSPAGAYDSAASGSMESVVVVDASEVGRASNVRGGPRCLLRRLALHGYCRPLYHSGLSFGRGDNRRRAATGAHGEGNQPRAFARASSAAAWRSWKHNQDGRERCESDPRCRIGCWSGRWCAVEDRLTGAERART